MNHLAKQIVGLEIDVAEMTVAVDDFEGTLIEFVEVNHYSALEVLQIITSLLSQGFARLDTGNCTYTTLKLVWVEKIAERGISQPYLAA